MNNRWAIIGALLVVAGMIAVCIVVTLRIDLTPKAEKAARPTRRQTLGEGIRVTQHGLYGIDLVSIGKAHMRKLRKGPFTIGAINELVLEDVSLTLPEELWKPPQPSTPNPQPSTLNPQPPQPSHAGPREMLGKLGVNAGSLKMGAKVPRFSALAIKNMRVARLDGTNAVPWFAATHGEARRGGLALEGVWAFDNGKTNAWREAMLVIEPTLRLVPLR